MMGKDIPCKHQSKENWNGNINIGQSIKQRKSPGIKGTLHNNKRVNLLYEDDITILNVPNNRASKCITQILIELKRKMDKSTVIVEDVNSSLNN